MIIFQNSLLEEKVEHVSKSPSLLGEYAENFFKFLSVKQMADTRHLDIFKKILSGKTGSVWVSTIYCTKYGVFQ